MPQFDLSQLDQQDLEGFLQYMSNRYRGRGSGRSRWNPRDSDRLDIRRSDEFQHNEHPDSPPYEVANKRYEQGIGGHYTDSYGPLGNYLGATGSDQVGGVPGELGQLLHDFQGSPNDLEEYLRWSAPFIASQMAGTDGFQRLQNVQAADPMNAFAGSAQHMDASAANAHIAGSNQLDRSGLGTASNRAALAGQVAGGAARGKADLYSQLMSQRNATMQAAAMQGLDAHRVVASTALGAIPAYQQQPAQYDARGQALGQVANLGGQLISNWINTPNQPGPAAPNYAGGQYIAPSSTTIAPPPPSFTAPPAGAPAGPNG